MSLFFVVWFNVPSLGLFSSSPSFNCLKVCRENSMMSERVIHVCQFLDVISPYALIRDGWISVSEHNRISPQDGLFDGFTGSWTSALVVRTVGLILIDEPTYLLDLLGFGVIPLAAKLSLEIIAHLLNFKLLFKTFFGEYACSFLVCYLYRLKRKSMNVSYNELQESGFASPTCFAFSFIVSIQSQASPSLFISVCHINGINLLD